MPFFAKTLADYIVTHLQQGFARASEEGREHRVVLPSLPAPVACSLGTALSDFIAAQPDRICSTFKVAQELVGEWQESPSEAERGTARKLIEKGWADSAGSLTHYRNVKLDAGAGRFMVTVLVGVDKVTDQASLSDFFRVDGRRVWSQYMRRSFSDWLSDWLTENHIAFEDDHLAEMDVILCNVRDASLADLYGISEFLDHLDLSGAQDGRDVRDLVLLSLSSFGLPVFRGVRQRGRHGIADYIGAAVSFFNYSDFLDTTKRRRALKAVDAFGAAGEQLEPDDLGNYESADALLDDLRDYIGEHDQAAKRRLLSANFVAVADKILAFRKPAAGPGSPRRSIKKLAGSPLEAVLTGTWLALADFKKEERGLAQETLTGLEIAAELFKHDCDGRDQGARAESARQLLQACIGGLDAFLEDHLVLRPDRVGAPDREVRVESRLVPSTEGCDLKYGSARAGEPGLVFSVTVRAGKKMIKRLFQWRFPETHPYRNVCALFRWAYAELQQRGLCLPVFAIPFFTELMLAKDEEEANRVLRQAVKNQPSMLDLLAAPGLRHDDPLLPALRDLAHDYGAFVKETVEKGFFSGLEAFDPLCARYVATCEERLRTDRGASSTCTPLLFKAFLVVGVPTSEGFHYWEEYQPAAVVTALHPALLEMIRHQHVFLVESFCEAAEASLALPPKQAFKQRRWDNIVDLATINTPLYGLLVDSNRKLDTHITSLGLIHRLGVPPTAEATLTTRLLLRYDATEDEGIADADLFRASRDSLLVERVLLDFAQLHAHASDGISIAAYCGQAIQPLIAGVDSFLTAAVERRTSGERPYHLSLTLFADTGDDTGVTRWVHEWRKRWEQAEAGGSMKHYRNCRISVAHRLVCPSRTNEQFRRLISADLQVDVAILMDFIQAGDQGNEFQAMKPYRVDWGMIKFPMLEKACCTRTAPGEVKKRRRIISSRQFRIATLHSEIMARLKHPSTPGEGEHVVLGMGDYAPWEGVVDDLHERSAWVVCIDPCIDEHLIRKGWPAGERRREVIGFGAGVGAHGELNYTISTELFCLADVEQKVAAQLGGLVSEWSGDSLTAIAHAIICEAQRLSGLSLVRATGPSDYVRDYVAYALVRKLLPPAEGAVCDDLVSLDAFRHWFDDAELSTRPDLLHLVARVEDGRLLVDAHLVECKLAGRDDAYLAKAYEQLANGLRHLCNCFRPRADRGASAPRRLRLDQRYWWLQLHRLIASKSQVAPMAFEATVSALERLAEGDFDICWRATAIGFWTDQDGDACVLEDTWDFALDDQKLDIAVVSSGRDSIHRICLSGATFQFPSSGSSMRLAAARLGRVGPASGDMELRTAQEGPLARPVGGRTTAQADEWRNQDSVPSRPHDLAVPAETRQGDALREEPEDAVADLVDRVHLGESPRGSRPVFWEFGHPELPNRHLLLFGTSGMGKTYAIQAILCELGKEGQNSLIVDYTNGFEDTQLDDATQRILAPTQHRVQLEPVRVNPFRRQCNEIGGRLYPEKPADTAQRVMSVFASVYDLGDQQRSALYSAIKSGIGAHGESMGLGELVAILEHQAQDKAPGYQYAGSLLSKIRPFVDGQPFGDEDQEGWGRVFRDPDSRCHIIQLAGCGREFARLVTEFSLIDLYWYFRGCGDQDHPRVIVLDEVQNLDHSLRSPVGQFLTEGRKFGISLVLATQTLSNLKQEERDRLFQAAHKLFFKPADTEMTEYARILEHATSERRDSWIKRLASLRRGECYSLGPSLAGAPPELVTKAIRLKIASLEERFTNVEETHHGV